MSSKHLKFKKISPSCYLKSAKKERKKNLMRSTIFSQHILPSFPDVEVGGASVTSAS
jgi:hypothetical protein